jgi:hypothetical protein
VLGFFEPANRSRAIAAASTAALLSFMVEKTTEFITTNLFGFEPDYSNGSLMVIGTLFLLSTATIYEQLAPQQAAGGRAPAPQ